jgi:deoxycytidylate deaminase
MFPISLIRHENPELFFALVAPVGADLDRVCEHLRTSLQKFDYSLEEIRLITLLRKFKTPRFLRDEPTDVFDRTNGRMDAGDEFRALADRDDALALLGLYALREFRKSSHQKQNEGEGSAADIPLKRQVYLFRSLKRPEEVTALRRIYGSNLIVIGVHCAREKRVQNLSEKIAKSSYKTQAQKFRHQAESLVLRDEADENKVHGQRLRSAFSMSDVFLDASEAESLTHDTDRFLNLLFGKPVITPTKSEMGMAHAYVAAMRSAELGRQVGAAIVDDAGNVVALGTNEVPRKGGGSYWERESPDHRDWQEGVDSSEEFKRASLGELLFVLSEKKKFTRKFGSQPVEGQIRALLPLLKQTRYMQLIEFIRSVHGEMSALMDAALRGVSVRGCTLYVTTFPCHECARHIIAAGINKVYYIEPYAKSLAIELHHDALQLDSETDQTKVPFVPYLGVAPRAYTSLFAMAVRKRDDGKVIEWDEKCANPRVSGSFWSYIQYEKEDLNFLAETFEKRGLKLQKEGKSEGHTRAKKRPRVGAQGRSTVAGLAAKRRSPREGSRASSTSKSRRQKG